MNVLACHTVEDLSDPKEGAVRGHHCEKCNREIWVMPRNLKIKEITLQCRECAFALPDIEAVLPASAAHETQVEPPS